MFVYNFSEFWVTFQSNKTIIKNSYNLIVMKFKDVTIQKCIFSFNLFKIVRYGVGIRDRRIQAGILEILSQLSIVNNESF